MVCVCVWTIAAYRQTNSPSRLACFGSAAVESEFNESHVNSRKFAVKWLIGYGRDKTDNSNVNTETVIIIISIITSLLSMHVLVLYCIFSMQLMWRVGDWPSGPVVVFIKLKYI